MDLDEDQPQERSKCAVCMSGFKLFSTFLLSHIGLISLVVSYCLIGAGIFEALEAENEKLVKGNITKTREAVSVDLWKMTREAEIIIPEEWSKNASKILKEFEKELLAAMKKRGWDGNEDHQHLQWTFTGALFYSIITITTIGYGHITPKTTLGKICTIFYAIVGIPLMVVCWSHIGDFMANSFRFIYWRICCFICTRRPKKRGQSFRGRGRSVRGPPSSRSGSARVRRSIRRSARVSQRSADSAPDSVISTVSDPGVIYTEQLQFPASSQFQRISRTSHTHGKPGEIELTANLKSMPILFNKYADEVVIKDQPERVERLSGITAEKVSPGTAYAHCPPEELLDYWLEEDFDHGFEYEEEDSRERDQPVPIYLCFLLVISYIVGGGYLFSEWEGWNFLDSSYFCFITLTTIGFGDFVPSQSSEVSIALCSLYLLFGIALLAMSFNLVQEQVINAFKSLAISLGIIDEDD